MELGLQNCKTNFGMEYPYHHNLHSNFTLLSNSQLYLLNAEAEFDSVFECQTLLCDSACRGEWLLSLCHWLFNGLECSKLVHCAELSMMWQFAAYFPGKISILQVWSAECASRHTIL